MATFDQLVSVCQPAYWDEARDAVTTGETWSLREVEYGMSADGTDPFDWTGVTGVCRITNRLTGAQITTLTVTFPAPGEFVLSKPAADTAAIPPGLYGWDLTFTNGTRKALIWGGPGSRIRVRPV